MKVQKAAGVPLAAGGEGVGQVAPAAARVGAGQLQAPQQRRQVAEGERRGGGRRLIVVDLEGLVEPARRQQPQGQVPPDVDGEGVLIAPGRLPAAQQAEGRGLIAGALVDVGQRVEGPQVERVVLQGQPAEPLGLPIAAPLLEGEGVLALHEPPARVADRPRLDRGGRSPQPAPVVSDVQVNVVGQPDCGQVAGPSGQGLPSPARLGELAGGQGRGRGGMAEFPLGSGPPAGPVQVFGDLGRVGPRSGEQPVGGAEDRAEGERLVSPVGLGQPPQRIAPEVQQVGPGLVPRLNRGLLAGRHRLAPLVGHDRSDSPRYSRSRYGRPGSRRRRGQRRPPAAPARAEVPAVRVQAAMSRSAPGGSPRVAVA